MNYESKTREELIAEIESLRRHNSDTKYRQLFDTMLNGVALHEIICNEEGTPIDYRFLEINPAFETLTGLKAENIIGKTVREVMPDTEDYWIQTYGNIALGGEDILYENYSIELGKHFEVTCYSPEYGKFITVFSDISARKEIEQIHQLRLDLLDYSRDHSLQEIMQLTLDEICEFTHSPIGFYHYFDEDQKSIILQAWSTNTIETYCEITAQGEHYPLDEAGVWADCLRERKGIIHNDYASLEGKKGLPDGHAVVLRELAVPVFREGKIVAVLGIGNKPKPYSEDDIPKVTFLADSAWEICELKQAEIKLRSYNTTLEELVNLRTEELEKSNDALRSFAYSVAHDLRAPLRSIRGFGDILAEEFSKQLDEEALNYLERIRNSAKKMDELILALLEFSRVSNQDLNFDTLNMSNIAEELTSIYQQQNTNRKVSVSIENGLQVEGDEQLIRILLDNLLSNAWKYTSREPDAKIKFGTVKIRNERVFFIEDNGIGFDMEVADKIFAPFQRLHDSEQFDGTGIGLSTAKQVVQRHQGDIWVNAKKGKGATFYFTLGNGRV